MTRPGPKGPRRPQMAVRVAEGGLAQIDKLAEQASVKRSEMARRLLAAAVADPKIRRAVARDAPDGAPVLPSGTS